MTENEKQTVEHITKVMGLIFKIKKDLTIRAGSHDASKLDSPEKEIFEEYTPKLAKSTYGSKEYKAFLKEMGPALDHHYAKNSHHPEFHKNGIDDMNLMDVIEMFCDWLAATMRHKDGNIYKSIEFNKKRFGLSDQLANIFKNTVKKLK